MKDASKVKSFPKLESYGEWKYVRWINSRVDSFKVWCGPLFHAIEEVVYEDPHFIKHTPVPERPAKVMALKRAGLRYFQTDFTSFEKHFTAEVQRNIEFVLYEELLPWLPADDLKFLFSVLTGKNHLRTRVGVSAVVKARRMSGEMNTSLGNGFTNLMLALFVAHEQGFDLDGFVEGDDGLFAVNGEITTQMYAGLGFDIKIDEVDDPCEASFCGMIFSRSGQIIRDPKRFLQTFGWTHSCIHAGDKVMNQLLRAKALSACYETPNCPIVGVIARKALDHTANYAPRFVEDGYHNTAMIPRDTLDLPKFAPDMSTRHLFARKFKISIPEQLRAEAAIKAGNLNILADIVPSNAAVLRGYTHYVGVG